jgi:hypothetical protein
MAEIMSKENPVFIVGVFRSGTSLLCSLLNQNPKISLMYECDVWNFPRPLLKSRFKFDWAERMEFYNNALSRHWMFTKTYQEKLKKVHTPLDLYRAFGEKKKAAVHGEKSPFYCNRLEQLHKQYPNASFVIVWRNPVEIYRSVRKAGQGCRFFGKRGMLSRMIYLQEQAIRQAAKIEKRGARIFRVDYANVVDHTEMVCRGLSAFLDVPFDPQMLHLNRADLSAIYNAPHHAHLRRGIIERQKYTETLMSPRQEEKLGRYRRRWEQQQAQWLNPSSSANQSTPGGLELAYHNAVGRSLLIYDSLVRAGFEFLPLAWLRAYRGFKAWALGQPVVETFEKSPLLEERQPVMARQTFAEGVPQLSGHDSR